MNILTFVMAKQTPAITLGESTCPNAPGHDITRSYACITMFHIRNGAAGLAFSEYINTGIAITIYKGEATHIWGVL